MAVTVEGAGIDKDGWTELGGMVDFDSDVDEVEYDDEGWEEDEYDVPVDDNVDDEVWEEDSGAFLPFLSLSWISLMFLIAIFLLCAWPLMPLRGLSLC